MWRRSGIWRPLAGAEARGERGEVRYTPDMSLLLLLAACALPTPTPVESLMVDEAVAACEAGAGEACMEVAGAYRELAESARAKDPEGCCIEPAKQYEVKACTSGFEDGCREVVRHESDPCPVGEGDARIDALRRLCVDHEDAGACAAPAQRAQETSCAWSEQGLPEPLVAVVEAACADGDGLSCRQLALGESDPARALTLHVQACGAGTPRADSCAEASAMLEGGLQTEGQSPSLDLLQRACKLSPQQYCGDWAELALSRCERGDAEACVRLARALKDGDEASARGLLEQSCETGAQASCAELEAW